MTTENSTTHDLSRMTIQNRVYDQRREAMKNRAYDPCCVTMQNLTHDPWRVTMQNLTHDPWRVTTQKNTAHDLSRVTMQNRAVYFLFSISGIIALNCADFPSIVAQRDVKKMAFFCFTESPKIVFQKPEKIKYKILPGRNEPQN